MTRQITLVIFESFVPNFNFLQLSVLELETGTKDGQTAWLTEQRSLN